MKVAALISGGKDSALALYYALKRGLEVSKIVTLIPLSEDSWMFHYPNAHLTRLFAEASGIPLVSKETSGRRDEELEDLKNILAKLDIQGLVFGAVASRYQKERIDRICEELGVKSIAPLWGEDPYRVLDSLIKLRFEVIVVGVYAHGFDDSWLGRRIDAQTIQALTELNRKFGVSPIGEGGEYETLVLDAPFFIRKIKIIKSEKVWKRYSGYMNVLDAELEDKTLSGEFGRCSPPD
ncbi:MAG: TIGR00289 family protein [Candidatus Bathyarchaeia archaeon]